ncbi:hypothetical protein LCGC14_0739570 [marine sediment metagenome]|uniref:Uncharacterized protein n=1 Tax=marine sediment metagenome TaxID=412755 RepID=A0A0F9Q776_9ZZZZ
MAKRKCGGNILCEVMNEQIGINLEWNSGRGEYKKGFHIYSSPDIDNYEEPYAELIKIDFCPFCGADLEGIRK